MTPDTIGLYLHIPFCTVKCGYCDFNAYAGHEHVVPSYAQALLSEAALWRRAVGSRMVGTVAFGGGTPSLLPLDEMERLIAGLHGPFEIAPGAEISLEANPRELTLDYLRGLRALGLTRLSIGVQSFDDDELRALDRVHTAEGAREAYACARAAGVTSVNLDLMYGLPGQPLAAWHRTLDEAVMLTPDHLSLYALTIEEGTPLAREVARGQVPAPDPDVQADCYEWAEERLGAAGYEHYEISNWARPGHRSRHNVIYWENREYLGLGAGAHSFLNGVRFSTVLLPNRYVELVEESAATMADGAGAMRHIAAAEPITPELAMADTMILGLRLIEGVAVAAFEQRFSRSVEDVYGDVIDEFAGHGLLERTPSHVRLTGRGRLLANEVCQRFLPEPSTANVAAQT